MNIILWFFQILLGFWNIIGAIYMMNNYKALANAWALSSLPYPFWIILGLFQILFSLGLILSTLIEHFPKLTSLSALGIAIISMLGIGIYATYTGAGIFWAILPAIIALFIAYKRWPTKSSR